MGYGDADARRDHRRLRAEQHRPCERRTDAFSGSQGVGGAHHVADEDHELVASQSGDGVAGPDDLGEAAPSLPEQVVAGTVAQRIVHHLEPVEVQEQHTDHPALASRTVQGVLEAVEKQRPVGQARQLVVVRPFLELRRHLDPLGDVPGVDHDAGDRRVAQQVGGHDLHVPPAAPGVGHPGLERRRHARRLQDRCRLGAEGLVVVGMHEVQDRNPLQFDGLTAQHPGDRRAGVGDVAALPHHADQVGGVLDQGRQADLGGLDPLLRSMQVGQVPAYHRDGGDDAVVVAVGNEEGRHGQCGAAVEGQAQLPAPRSRGADPRKGRGGEPGL